jgi:hypothetical protein
LFFFVIDGGLRSERMRGAMAIAGVPDISNDEAATIANTEAQVVIAP